MTYDTTTYTHGDCLDRRDDSCSGETHPRESLSGTGTPITRCDSHWSRRLDEHADHLRVYPDSPHAPSWFDPLAAGEVW